MQLFDTVCLDGTRTTSDGYLVADAKIARTGVQVYLGRELGRPELGSVRVWRPEDEVFSADAMASFAHRPVTNDHPPELVTAENWKRYARGQTGGEIVRDGGFLRVPLMLADASAIAAVQGGKRELSAGYTCDIEFIAGMTPSGDEYDAIQRNVRGNHLAVVRRGRAGAECRIGDQSEHEDTPDMRTILIDGLSVETNDDGATALEQLRTRLSDAMSKADAAQVRVDAKDGEIAAMAATHTSALAALRAQIPTAAVLDAAIVARLGVVDAARKILGAAFDATGKTDAEIRRATVAARLGEAKLEGRSDDYVQAAFDTLTALPAQAHGVGDPLRDAIRSGKSTAQDASPSSAYEEYCAELRDAHKSNHNE